MPFILEGRRKLMDIGAIDKPEPGDRCYKYYKQMVEEWRKDPRWTTAHSIYKKMRSQTKITYEGDAEGFENQMAYELAWQCFFYFHVLEYEKKKMKENGDI